MSMKGAFPRKTRWQTIWDAAEEGLMDANESLFRASTQMRNSGNEIIEPFFQEIIELRKKVAELRDKATTLRKN